MKKSTSSFEMLVVRFFGFILAFFTLGVAALGADGLWLYISLYALLSIIILLSIWGTIVRNHEEFGVNPMNIGEFAYNVIDYSFSGLLVFAILFIALPVTPIVYLSSGTLDSISTFLWFLIVSSISFFLLTIAAFLPRKSEGIRANNRETSKINVTTLLTKIGVVGAFIYFTTLLF